MKSLVVALIVSGGIALMILNEGHGEFGKFMDKCVAEADQHFPWSDRYRGCKADFESRRIYRNPSSN